MGGMIYRLTRPPFFPDPFGCQPRRFEPVIECETCHEGETFEAMGVRFLGFHCKCGATFVPAKRELAEGDTIIT